MMPEHIALRQAIAEERARLLELLWHDIGALRQMVDKSQQLMDAELHSQESGTAAAPLPTAEHDASA